MNNPQSIDPSLNHEASPQPLRVLFIASEADPLIKVGGLGDVTGSLPITLRTLKQSHAEMIDIRLAIPFHNAVKSKVKEITPIASFSVPHPKKNITAQAYETHVGNLPVYLIAGEPIPEDAPVYSLDTRQDGEKYTFFSLATLELARALNWNPDILHANDWHTALAVYMLRERKKEDEFFKNTRTILTVHNLPFMGAGIDSAMDDFGIPPLDDDRLPPWGSYQPLPMGLASADHITTVSPTYAREILTPEFGCGLQDFLGNRAASISGILNGLDEDLWNPSTDPALPATFDSTTIDQRLSNKRALLEEFSLPDHTDLPLIILISRMDWQKGVDLAIEGLRQVASMPWQAILLGTGDPTLEAGVRHLEAEFPYRVRGVIRFDAKLSRRMYAGGDMLLMPSRYEPCGLAQMIAMRYGCIPVARATGGLRDTIRDSQNPETSTGFLFEDTSPEALASALRRALAAFGDRSGWLSRQLFAMQQDFSWERSAHAYVQIYQKLLQGDSSISQEG